MNYDWFMNARRARLLVKIFGRGGARIFYMALGLLIVGAGVVMYMSGAVPE
ncbi:MAG: immunity 17 family protein [Synergistaceae bacterium]|jgi:hypothetical protein|nr:immunity 17 family protein [Synergistaceae bacterium]